MKLRIETFKFESKLNMNLFIFNQIQLWFNLGLPNQKPPTPQIFLLSLNFILDIQIELSYVIVLHV